MCWGGWYRWFIDCVAGGFRAPVKLLLPPHMDEQAKYPLLVSNSVAMMLIVVVIVIMTIIVIMIMIITVIMMIIIVIMTMSRFMCTAGQEARW